MRSHLAIYAGGDWRDRASAERLPIVNPATEEVIAEIAAATSDDVGAAVEAAESAREEWEALGFSRRAVYLGAIAGGLEQRRAELVDLIITEVGTPRSAVGPMQVDVAINTFRELAALAGEWERGEQIGSSEVCRVPAGVAGLITPWNYPLYQIALKVAPALAAGCSVVLKPSEVAPLNAFVLAEVVDEANLPAGVFNMVLGTGTAVGEAIVRHPGVDIVSFTGSVGAGKRVARLAADGVKRVMLELGGKGASVVLEGADIDAAVAHCVRSCFSNAGQTCAALTRLIVPRSQLASVEKRAKGIAERYVVGDPLNPDTQLGPVVSDRQRQRVRALIETGAREGARRLIGDADRTLPATGFYVAPTVFSDVTPTMTIAQEEIFGPVLSIMPVDSEDEAIAVANATRYGLTAAVWAPDHASARAVAGRIRFGSVTLNGGKFNPAAPFGGFKQSGYGRERGRLAIEEYLALKSYNA